MVLRYPSRSALFHSGQSLTVRLGKASADWDTYSYLFNIFIGGLLTFCGFNTLASKIASFARRAFDLLRLIFRTNVAFFADSRFLLARRLLRLERTRQGNDDPRWRIDGRLVVG